MKSAELEPKLAHRPETVANADRVIVINCGRVISDYTRDLLHKSTDVIEISKTH